MIRHDKKKSVWLPDLIRNAGKLFPSTCHLITLHKRTWFPTLVNAYRVSSDWIFLPSPLTLTNTSHRWKTLLMREMRFPTLSAMPHHWLRMLHSCSLQVQELLTNPSSSLFHLVSTIHRQDTAQAKKMQISFRHSINRAHHTPLDLLPSLQTQAMSARLLKRFPQLPSLLPTTQPPLLL